MARSSAGARWESPDLLESWMNARSLLALAPFAFVAACGSRNELTADRPPIAEHSFASGSRPPPAGALGGVLPVPQGIAYLGEWRIYGVPVNPYRCVYDPERFAPVGCEPNDCLAGTAPVPTLKFEVASYLLMAREARRSDLDACISEGRCVAENYHPVDRDYPDTLALSTEEARAFCRAYGGDLPTQAQFARALVDGEEFLPAESLAELAASPPACLRGTPQPVGPDSPFGHRELAGREAESVRSSGYIRLTPESVRAPCAPVSSDDPTRTLSEEEDGFGVELPICQITFNGSEPTSATRYVRGIGGSYAFRCAFPTQVIP